MNERMNALWFFVYLFGVLMLTILWIPLTDGMQPLFFYVAGLGLWYLMDISITLKDIRRELRRKKK